MGEQPRADNGAGIDGARLRRCRFPQRMPEFPQDGTEFSLSDSLSYSLGKTRGDGSERRIGETDQRGGGIDENCGGAGN